VLPCPAYSCSACPALSCLFLLCLSCPVLLSPALPVLPCPALSCSACPALSCFVLLCLSCPVLLCRPALCVCVCVWEGGWRQRLGGHKHISHTVEASVRSPTKANLRVGIRTTCMCNCLSWGWHSGLVLPVEGRSSDSGWL
jgi:hypothetical protein